MWLDHVPYWTPLRASGSMSSLSRMREMANALRNVIGFMSGSAWVQLSFGATTGNVTFYSTTIGVYVTNDKATAALRTRIGPILVRLSLDVGIS